MKAPHTFPMENAPKPSMTRLNVLVLTTQARTDQKHCFPMGIGCKRRHAATARVGKMRARSIPELKTKLSGTGSKPVKKATSSNFLTPGQASGWESWLVCLQKRLRNLPHDALHLQAEQAH